MRFNKIIFNIAQKNFITFYFFFKIKKNYYLFKKIHIKIAYNNNNLIFFLIDFE